MSTYIIMPSADCTVKRAMFELRGCGDHLVSGPLTQWEIGCHSRTKKHIHSTKMRQREDRKGHCGMVCETGLWNAHSVRNKNKHRLITGLLTKIC